MGSSESLTKTLSRLSMSQSAPTLPEQPAGMLATMARGPGALFGAGRGKLASLWSCPSAPPDELSSEASEPATESADKTPSHSVSDAAANVCYPAGLDLQDRQILVLSLASLPDPDKIPYDELIDKVLRKVEMVCEQDYVLVLLAAKRADGHVPGWGWIARAYLKLERKYRKNLKKLYVVHPSFFIRVTLPLLLPLVSPKFLQKLVYVYTLSDLSEEIPIQQLRVGLDVLVDNGKQEPDGFNDHGGRSRLGQDEDVERGVADFRVPLEKLMPDEELDQPRIPKVLLDCAEHILTTSAIDAQGIFRKSSNLVLVRQVASAYNHGLSVNLADFHDANLAGHLIKKFLRDLPEPIIPELLYGLVESCPLDEDDSVLYLRETFLAALGWRERKVLGYILHLMHKVADHSSNNLMTASNLAIVMSPVLIRSPNPVTDVLMCSLPGSGTVKALAVAGLSKPDGRAPGMTVAGVLKVCIERFPEVFGKEDTGAAIEVPCQEDWEFVHSTDALPEHQTPFTGSPVKTASSRRLSRSSIPHDLFVPSSPGVTTANSPVKGTKSRTASASLSSRSKTSPQAEHSRGSASSVELAGVQAGAVFIDGRMR